MTHALHRFSAAIFGWIPDLSRIPPRRRVTLGIVASILLHVLAILIVGLMVRPQAPPAKLKFLQTKIKPRSIELTIIPPEPEPEPFVPFTMAAPVQPFIDSLGLDVGKEAAEHPIFESDENMRAASERPATGDAPLPSQEGRDRPFNAFKTQKSLLGMVAPQPFPPAPAAPAVNTPPPPSPVAPPPKVAKQEAPPAPAPPEAVRKPDAPPKKPITPADMLREVNAAKDDEIALTAKPVPTAVTEIDKTNATPAPVHPAATPQPVEQHAKLSTPAPRMRAARESGFQPEQEQNRIEGSISNRGRASVDAIATPMGKFRKRVNSLIGSRWTYYVQNPPQPGLYAFGTAEVKFYITKEGKVEGLKVLSNSSNRSYAEMCLTAISDARKNDADSFQPPDGALDVMRDGRLEYFLTFTYYSY